MFVVTVISRRIVAGRLKFFVSLFTVWDIGDLEFPSGESSDDDKK